MMEEQKRNEALKAVRAMNPEKVWPVLLTLTKDRDSPLRAKLIEAVRYRSIPILSHLRPAGVSQLLGAAGFEALGEAGAPAVPELTRMLDDPERAFLAVRCLGEIGKPAQAALESALTNAQAQVRYQAVAALPGASDEVDEFFARIQGCLRDPAVEVRFITVKTIALQTHAPETALPLLLGALADAHDSVFDAAAGALPAFGTNALVALPVLRRVATGSSEMRARRALRAWATLAPEEALPILLGHLEGHSPAQRRMAASLFGSYTNTTPAMIAALQRAAQDSDRTLSNTAWRTLTKLTTTNTVDDDTE